AVVASVPAGGLAIAALVGRDDVKAGLRERRHHLAPAEGELGKAVQQQHRRPARLACLEHVHDEAVYAVDAARAQAGGQVLQSRKMRSALPPRTLSRTSPGSASTRERHPAMSPMVCG